MKATEPETATKCLTPHQCRTCSCAVTTENVGKGTKRNYKHYKLSKWEITYLAGGKLSEPQEWVGRNTGFMVLPWEIELLACRVTNASRTCLSLPGRTWQSLACPLRAPGGFQRGNPGLGLLQHRRQLCRSQEQNQPNQPGFQTRLFPELIPAQAACGYTENGNQGRAGAGSSSSGRFGSSLGSTGPVPLRGHTGSGPGSLPGPPGPAAQRPGQRRG